MVVGCALRLPRGEEPGRCGGRGRAPAFSARPLRRRKGSFDHWRPGSLSARARHPAGASYPHLGVSARVAVSAHQAMPHELRAGVRAQGGERRLTTPLVFVPARAAFHLQRLSIVGHGSTDGFEHSLGLPARRRSLTPLRSSHEPAKRSFLISPRRRAHRGSEIHAMRFSSGRALHAGRTPLLAASTGVGGPPLR